MKPSAYDRTLIALTLLAPLLLLVLTKWRASLDTLYAPAGVSEQFTQHVSEWLGRSNESGSRLIVIVDRDCPCTKASLRILESARGDVPLTVRDIEEVDPAVRDELPSTPTLLAVEGRQLVYAGPVTSGNLCTTAVQRVLGVTALQAPRARPILNWLDTGCYCRRQPQTFSRASSATADATVGKRSCGSFASMPSIKR
jgi:hypothetical protein